MNPENFTALEKRKLRRNFWLFFIFNLSQRRLFYVLIGIYFLTLPKMSENVHMLGWFISAGSLASFLLEIPSGYISDLFGHKKTLVLAKIAMILSTLMYIFANHWIFFLLGSILISTGFAFQSGTISAIFHNTTEALNRENEYTKLRSKMSANVSLISAILLTTTPFLAEINILLPFYIALGLDFIGFIAVLFITGPRKINNKNLNTKQEVKKIREVFMESKQLGFLPFILLSGFLAGIGGALGPFREVFLQSLGMKIAFIGFLAGLSRLIWFTVGHFAHQIEKNISIKQIMFSQLFFTSLFYLIISFLSNPYIILFLMATLIGTIMGTSSIRQKYFLTHYIKDKNYKATALSINAQIFSLFTIPFSFGAGYIMTISYSFGYLFAGIFSLIGGLIIWQFLKNKLD